METSTSQLRIRSREEFYTNSSGKTLNWYDAVTPPLLLSSKKPLVQTRLDKSSNKNSFHSKVVTGANKIPLGSQSSYNQVSKNASSQTFRLLTSPANRLIDLIPKIRDHEGLTARNLTLKR
ncbi:hypothetical protein RCL_jg3569.t1 [Rhizophagus clarus]|uniref:Uncharacterized protein n=1 Tax=Rhizophagus clarus TaxID=94130 RepID=A0A8H3M770_9GLOM|nr:hypothetical protein RCL_jg3569.t1 [Rhizophagus clarus]